jgi:DNA mismatch endonuclease (patch repair protein)
MPDRLTKTQRSQLMSRIRSRGNASTELRLVALFRDHGITGWRRHLPLPGSPDFTFRKEKIAVFVDGCFWHGCPRCNWTPNSNREYWEKKLGCNLQKDRLNNRVLRQAGWKVIRIWEHALRKNPLAALARIQRALTSA